MEFPSDFMDEEYSPGNPNKPPPLPSAASPTSPNPPIARYSTAPPIPSGPNRASTYVYVKPGTNGAKSSAPTRSATVNGKKSNRLTRTFSRMIGKGNPRTARAKAASPVPEIKADDEGKKSPVIEPISEASAAEEADKKGENDVAPAVATAITTTEAVAPAETPVDIKPASDKVEAEEPAQPKEDAHKETLAKLAPTEAAATPEAQTTDAAALQPVKTNSTAGAEAQQLSDSEKKKKEKKEKKEKKNKKSVLPPVKTDPVMVAELAKLESLGSPLSIRSSEQGEKGPINGSIAAEVNNATEDATANKKKKKSGTGFFSIFRVRRKNNNNLAVTPQIAAN